MEGKKVSLSSPNHPNDMMDESSMDESSNTEENQTSQGLWQTSQPVTPSLIIIPQQNDSKGNFYKMQLRLGLEESSFSVGFETAGALPWVIQLNKSQVSCSHN